MAHSLDHVLVGIALVVGCTSTACSTKDAPSQVGDGGSGDGASAAMDASAAASGDAMLTGEPYCDAIEQNRVRCAVDAGRSPACVAAKNSQCPQSEAVVYSALWKTASIACLAADQPCGDRAFNTCTDAKLAGFTPSTAQAKLRDDYCATCGGDASADCKAKFFVVGSGTAAVPGVGGFVPVITDALVGKIDAKCTGAALAIGSGSDCEDAFYSCFDAQVVMAFAAEPAACME